jgi:hypothetical protein
MKNSKKLESLKENIDLFDSSKITTLGGSNGHKYCWWPSVIVNGEVVSLDWGPDGKAGSRASRP